MYHQFTPDARRSMQSANRQAMRVGHEYIGTDDILIGIVTNASGIVAEVLSLHGVTEPKLQECLAALPRSEGPVPTGRGKTVVENAMKRAKELYHLEGNLTHVLLGLLDGSPSDATYALEKVGVGIDQMKQDILDRCPVGSPEEVAGQQEIEQKLKDHPEVLALKQQIDKLQPEKERAIANQNFTLAASVLKQQDVLRRALEALYKKLSQ